MHFKPNVDVAQFLKRVNHCKGEVRFCTTEKDVLVLNSALSKYFFAYLVEKTELLYAGEIVCEKKEDETVLDEFLVRNCI